MRSPLNVSHFRGLLERNKTGVERERVREWRDKKRSIGKFCRLWWCWKGNVLDRQSMPLVKFFHCVSFLYQTLLQSSSSHSFFFFRCLIRILLPFYASFHFLSLRPSPSFAPLPCLSVSFQTMAVSLFFSYFSPVICKFPFLFFYASFSTIYSPFPLLKPFLLSCPFLHASQSHLLGCCSHACKPH